MRILLDECITKRFKSYFPGYEVFSVSDMRWNGIKNGKLLTLCAEAGIEVFITIDKNLMHQQNLEKHALTIVVLNAASSKIEELILFLPSLKSQLLSFEKRKAYLVEKVL